MEFYGQVERQEKDYLDNRLLQELGSLLRQCWSEGDAEVKWLQIYHHPIFADVVETKQKSGTWREKLFLYFVKRKNTTAAIFVQRYLFHFKRKVKFVLRRAMAKINPFKSEV